MDELETAGFYVDNSELVEDDKDNAELLSPNSIARGSRVTILIA